MSKITLITGGNRSGKSSQAEERLANQESVLYIATAFNTDEEMTERIRIHRERRSKSWQTYEGHKGLGKVVREASEKYILLDCVTNMISNLMFYADLNLDHSTKEEEDRLFHEICSEFEDLLLAVRESDKELILVSNEVGMGLISEYKLGRLFVDFAGFINQYIAKESDEVLFMVAGYPLMIKSEGKESAKPLLGGK